MNDTTQTLVRSVLKIGAGALAAKGYYIDGSQMEIAASGVLALIGIIWGIYHRTPKAT